MGILSMIAVFFYSSSQIPFFTFLNLNAEKVFLLISIALITSLLYFINILIFKRVYLPENKFATLLFFLIPIIALLSVLFGKEYSNAFFGENFTFDSFLSFLALTFFVFTISLSARFMPKIT